MASNAVKKMKRNNQAQIKQQSLIDEERFRQARNRDEIQITSVTNKVNRRIMSDQKHQNQGGDKNALDVDEADYLRRQKVVDMFKNRANFGKELQYPRVFEKFGIQYDIDIDELLNHPLEEFGDEQEKIKEKHPLISMRQDTNKTEEAETHNPFMFQRQASMTRKGVKLIEEKKKAKFIFRPNDNFKSKWDLLIMVSAIFNCFTIPFKVAFEPGYMNTSIFNVVNLSIDFIFLIDIGISFRTALIDSYGNEIETPCEIAKHYLKAQFWIDLSATIPIDLIIESIMQKSNPFYELFGILKLGRVLRLIMI